VNDVPIHDTRGRRNSQKPYKAQKNDKKSTFISKRLFYACQKVFPPFKCPEGWFYTPTLQSDRRVTKPLHTAVKILIDGQSATAEPTHQVTNVKAQS